MAAAILAGTVAAEPVAEHAPRAADADAVAGLRAWLAAPATDRPPLDEQAFARAPLSAADAERATRLLWEDHAAWIRRDRAAEMRAREVRAGDARLRFETVVFPPDDAARPPARRALFLAMHGGGGVPAEINDSQWRNQVRLAAGYRPRHAIYVAPRAPVDAPAMWSVPAVDACFDRIIENLVVLADVDPDQVYLMGYSAGGDGAYQLAPRLADRFAAAAALAGHPNDASPLGLRNLPFTIHVGEHDRAYGRNAVAVVWERKLAALRADDPAGYEHVVRVHEGKGHWLDLDDREAIPWMQGFRRQALPARIVWRQGHTLHPRFYWLAAAADSVRDGDEVVATRAGPVIDVAIQHGAPRIVVRFNDAMVDLDGDVSIRLGGREVFAGRLQRTIATIARTLRERGDPAAVFSAEHALPAAAPIDPPAPSGGAAPADAAAPPATAIPRPSVNGTAADAAPAGPVAAALDRAGDNRGPLEALLARTPPPRRRGLEFLLAHMPAHDLRTLPADLLEENVACAYRALERAPWRERIDEALFLNDILPYCVLTERRDGWRPEMEARCRPLVDGIESPGAAAAALNRRLFPLIKVRYSRHRPLVDPSPAQAMASGLASCTGLSILLVAACRSVAIPARFVGIPAWPGDTGNHSWVEVWDDGWHFTGAAEPAGDRLDEAWFTGRAAGALRDDPRHAIHAASFTRRPDRLPLPWPDDADVRPWSVNVTDRYVRRADPLPEGRVRALLRVSATPAGDRVAAEFEVRDATGAVLASGRTRDERFDVHDDVPVVLARDEQATVRFSWDGRTWTETIRPIRDSARHEFVVPSRAAAGP